MEYVKLDNEREQHWRMVFEENNGGVDHNKAALHAKRWDVYVNEKKNLIKGEYLVEVVGSDRKKVICELLGYHAVED